MLWSKWLRTAWAAGSGIVEFVIIFMRRAGGQRQVLARTCAGIEQTSLQQFFPRAEVINVPFTLRVRSARSADVWTFLPLNPEPIEVLEHGAIELRPGSLLIQIVIAENQRASRVARTCCRNEKSRGVAEVQQPGWRGCQAATVGCCIWTELGHHGYILSQSRQGRRKTVYLFTISNREQPVRGR